MAVLREVTENTLGDAPRQPPVSYDIERALLGAIITNPNAYHAVSDILRSNYFGDELNARIYAACERILERNGRPTVDVLMLSFDGDDLLQSAGGRKYLTAIVANTVTIISAKDYATQIYNLHLRRELISVGEDIVNTAFDAALSDEAASQIEAAQERLYQLDHHSESDYQMVSLDTAVDKAIALAERAHKNDGAVVGVTTGLRDLDRKMSGLHPGDLIIVAGASSMGKTACAVTIGVNAARYFKTTERPDHAGRRVLCFSLEMGDEQLATRILAHAAGVSSFHMRAGGLSTEDWNRIVDAKGALSGTPLDIDPTPGITLAGIRSRCRKTARKKTPNGDSALGLIIIDYLQLISPARGERFENRTQQLAGITRGLKMLAKEFGVTVIALSQISRTIEQREDKRPQLSDLRESGTIENDSDAVLFVYREQYYLERNEPQQYVNETTEKFLARMSTHTQRLEKCHGTADIIIAKQRHGPIGTVTLNFDASGTHFSDLEKDDDIGFEQRTLI